MGPTLSRSTALQHFERSNAVEIRNRIMFDFYPGLPHICAIFLSFSHYSQHSPRPSPLPYLFLHPPFLLYSFFLPFLLPFHLIFRCFAPFPPYYLPSPPLFPFSDPLPQGIIPPLVVQCVGYINRDSVLREPGLFRIPGDVATIRRIRSDFVRGVSCV